MPLTKGRSTEILQLGRGAEHVMLARIKKLRVSNPETFIKRIRTVRRGAAVQALDPRFVAGSEHVLEVAKQSLHARKRGTMLSKRIEIDLLLRIACTNQISEALGDVGIKQGVNDLLIIAVGGKKDLQAIRKHLDEKYKKPTRGRSHSSRGDDPLRLSRGKMRLLISHHGISKDEISACVGEKNGLVSILAERANLLW